MSAGRYSYLSNLMVACMPLYDLGDSDLSAADMYADVSGLSGRLALETT